MSNTTKSSSWKNSNLSLIGSDLDHKIKTASAEHEGQWQALHEAMQHKGTTTTLVYRMEDFHVVPWPISKYGQFHVGDSYLVFHSQPKSDGNSDALEYHLHIWIGNDSSADEYGTAAYKMVEADEIVGGAAIQHREVQGHESDLFKSYFHGSKSLKYLQGGVASGFHHVEPTVEQPHLYRIKGTRKAMSLTQVNVKKSSLNEGDSYILYANQSKVWLWIGKRSNPDERSRASLLAEAMCTEGTVVVLEQENGGDDEDDEQFWNYLGTDGHIQRVNQDNQDDKDVVEFTPTLYKLQPGNNGNAIAVATGEPHKIGFGRPTPRIPKSTLDDSDVFLLDAGWELFVWIGNKASREERLAAMDQGQQYAKSQGSGGRTVNLPLTFIKAGYETNQFNDYFF